jgi:hypothetical protein
MLNAGYFISESCSRPFLGISIGSKPPSLEQSLDILKLMLRSTSCAMPIMFADEIELINYQVFGDSAIRASKIVERKKLAHVELWQTAVSNLTEEERSRFIFVNWECIQTPKLSYQQNVLRESFHEQQHLYDAILSLVSYFISSAGKTVTHKRCLEMAEYVIQELPTLLFGIDFNGINNQVLFYPTYNSTDEMEDLIADIRTKSCYSILRSKLDCNAGDYIKIFSCLLGDNVLQVLSWK